MNHSDDTIANMPYYKNLEKLFDKMAKLYDATYGPPSESGRGNALMGWLHTQHLTELRAVFEPGAAVLDIGCGTGGEALALAQLGYSVLGIDVSPVMVRQAQTKAAVHGFRQNMLFRTLPAGRLAKLDERGPFQGAYASLGTLNTEPDLTGVARGLHELLEPNAPFVATVMSQHCLFEILHNLFRFKSGQTPQRTGEWENGRAGAGGVVAPVKYYTPQEFAASFEPYFTVETVYAFPLWLPPVNQYELYNADPERYRQTEKRDRRMRTWKGFRAWGDHFLMVLRHKHDSA